MHAGDAPAGDDGAGGAVGVLTGGEAAGAGALVAGGGDAAGAVTARLRAARRCARARARRRRACARARARARRAAAALRASRICDVTARSAALRSGRSLDASLAGLEAPWPSALVTLSLEPPVTIAATREATRISEPAVARNAPPRRGRRLPASRGRERSREGRHCSATGRGRLCAVPAGPRWRTPVGVSRRASCSKNSSTSLKAPSTPRGTTSDHSGAFTLARQSSSVAGGPVRHPALGSYLNVIWLVEPVPIKGRWTASLTHGAPLQARRSASEIRRALQQITSRWKPDATGLPAVS